MKVIRQLLAAIFLLWLFSWYFGQVDTVTITKKSLEVGDKKRTYYLSTNSEKLKNKNVPLVIFLHGMDRGLTKKSTTNLQYSFIDTVAKDQSFIALFPRGSLGACDWDNNKYKDFYCWDTKDNFDRTFVRLLAEQLAKEFGTNPQKAFLIGYENGGYFVVSYILRHHLGDFSGYGIHSAGGYLFKNDPIRNYDYEKFLISMNIGTDDPYHQEDMKNLQKTFIDLGWKLNKNFRYHKFPGGLQLDNKSFKEELKFFFTH